MLAGSVVEQTEENSLKDTAAEHFPDGRGNYFESS